jgi:poly(A) polymerase
VTSNQGMTRLLKVVNEAPREGEHVYLVGGCVRDLLLDRPIKDLDLATDGNPRRLAERIARRTGGAPFVMHPEMRAYRVVPRQNGGGVWIDVLPLVGSLAEDLLRRDFTINAMALPLPFSPDRLLESLIDPAGGREDLRARRIRHVRPDIFETDPVRLLRAVRIGAAVGFTLAPETEALMPAAAPLLAQAAAERVRDELFALLTLPEPAASVRRLDVLGLLSPILPELDALKGVEQNPNHHLDAWEHTLEVLRQGDLILGGEELPEDVRTPAGALLEEIACPPRSRRALFRLTALLHDVAKPQTRTLTPEGVISFRGHDEEGAVVARTICQRLRLSTREAKSVALAVRAHLWPGFLSHEDPPSDRSRYRFFRDTGNAAVETLLLSLADRLAARGPWAAEAQIARHRRFVVEMLRLYFTGSRVAHPVLPVDGRGLMRALGLKQGPELGAILDALREAVAVGEVATRDEAVALARQHLAQHRAAAAPPSAGEAPGSP